MPQSHKSKNLWLILQIEIYAILNNTNQKYPSFFGNYN